MLNDVLHNIYFRIKCTRLCSHLTLIENTREGLVISNLLFFYLKVMTKGHLFLIQFSQIR